VLFRSVVGLRSVDPAISESAQGMGLNGRQRLWRIELPLAWPVILTGVRVSTVMLIAIAAVAAIVNGPGLGEDIFDGLGRIGTPNALNLVLGGTLGIVVLSLLFDAFFVVVGRLTTSGGIR
jgi:osmoprotectant transport system permease protein